MWEHRILDATTHTSMVLEQNSIETVFIEVYMITTLSKFNSIAFYVIVRFWNTLMVLF